MAVKMKKVWSYQRVEDRRLADLLNGLSDQGVEVFGVYASASIGGAFEVLTYKKVPIATAVPPPSRLGAAAPSVPGAAPAAASAAKKA